MTHTRFLHSRRKTLTIIELAVTIALIGILAVVALPRFDFYYTLKAEAAAKKLAADIRYVRSMAMSRHYETALRFDDAAEVYDAFWCSADCDVTGNWSRLKDSFTNLDLIVDYVTDPEYAGVDITNVFFGATDSVRFDWEGVPHDRNGGVLTAEGTVTLDVKGRTRTITISPQTAKITVQ